jgi:hypothetical protein
VAPAAPGTGAANGLPTQADERFRPLRIVSVMTTDSSGGAEFAAVEMLDALRERGHETVLLSDMAGIGRDTEVTVGAIDTGPKLSTRTWMLLAKRWPLLQRRFAHALEEQLPYDVLLVHYKKEQLMAGMLPKRLRATTVWAEWGPVPIPLRSGVPRLAYAMAARRASLVMAVSEGTREAGSGAKRAAYR